MNALLEKIALREDIGDLLADGVKRAADEIGPASIPFAVHCGGQEIAMHDPRFEPGLGVIYKINATPGRHTQGFQYGNHPDYPSGRPGFGENREAQKGRGDWVKEGSVLCHAMNCLGVCMFGFFATHLTFLPDFMTAVSGKQVTVEDMMRVGERIANIRQAFNVREGLNPVTQPLPERAYGRPPLPDGPTAGIDVQVEEMTREYLDTMAWTQDAAVPTRPVLESLGLDDIARDIWD
jgi:aldehyde:ferredoxin oxidoreductase